MSGNIKIALGIVIVAALIGGGYYWYSSTRPAPVPVAVGDTQTPASTGPTLPTGADTSDTALAQDVASVDADVSAMNEDTAAIDTGLNDKAVAQ